VHAGTPAVKLIDRGFHPLAASIALHEDRDDLLFDVPALPSPPAQAGPVCPRP